MAIGAKNIVSKGYTGNLTIPANNNRGYFYVVMTSAAGTVEFAEALEVNDEGFPSSRNPTIQNLHSGYLLFNCSAT